MAFTQTLPARAAAPAGRKRVRINWARGATLLIEGEKPAAICAALGIDEDRLWRHLRKSLRFQFLLRQARDRRRLLGRLKLEAVSADAALRGALQAEKTDAALFDSLAEAGRIAAAEDTAADGRDVIARLADIGRRPPNQALQDRLAAERKTMDATVDETRRLLAAHVARQAAAAQHQALQQARQRPQPDAAAPAQAADKPARNENKPSISADKPSLSPDQARIAPDRGAAAPDPAHPASAQQAPPQPAPQRRAAPPAMQDRGAIVDLTDMYGNPLADAGAGDAA